MILAIPQTIDGSTTHLVCFIVGGDSLVGSLQICADSNHRIVAKLHSLFVGKQCRLEGIGTKLMKRAEEIARSQACGAIGLHVSLANIEVRGFYEKLGYVPVYQFDDGDVQFIKQIDPFHV